LGGDFEEVLALILTKELAEKDIRFLSDTVDGEAVSSKKN